MTDQNRNQSNQSNQSSQRNNEERSRENERITQEGSTGSSTRESYQTQGNPNTGDDSFGSGSGTSSSESLRDRSSREPASVVHDSGRQNVSSTEGESFDRESGIESEEGFDSEDEMDEEDGSSR
jgi:hypothetical protein